MNDHKLEISYLKIVSPHPLGMALERIENLLQLPRQSFEKIELFKKKYSAFTNIYHKVYLGMLK